MTMQNLKIMDKSKYFLIMAGISAVSALVFSLLSLSVGVGDYNNLLIAFQIINRGVKTLALAVIILIIYLWIKQKNK